MPTDQLYVPVLPVLLPLGIVLNVLAGVLLRRRRRLTVPRLAAACLAGWYVMAVIGATLLPLRLSWGAGAGPPDLYRIIVVPLVTMRVDDFVLNIVMTLPLAALLHVVLGVRDRRRVVLVAFLGSAVIEVIQAVLVLALHGNRWADVNDLIANTSGAFLGHLWYWRAMRTRWLPRLVGACAVTGGEVRPVVR